MGPATRFAPRCPCCPQRHAVLLRPSGKSRTPRAAAEAGAGPATPPGIWPPSEASAGPQPAPREPGRCWCLCRVCYYHTAATQSSTCCKPHSSHLGTSQCLCSQAKRALKNHPEQQRSQRKATQQPQNKRHEVQACQLIVCSPVSEALSRPRDRSVLHCNLCLRLPQPSELPEVFPSLSQEVQGPRTFAWGNFSLH